MAYGQEEGVFSGRGQRLAQQPIEQGEIGRQLVWGMVQHPAYGADRRDHCPGLAWVGGDACSCVITADRVGAAGSRNGLRPGSGGGMVMDMSSLELTGDDLSCGW